MLADRVKKIKPSPTLAMDARAKAMKAQGLDIVNFGVGEPDFDTPEHVKEAAIKAIRDGFTKYTPVGGIDELKEAIIEKFKIDNNLEYTKEEILVSCGAKHSLYNIAQALYAPGDEVIIPSPYWVSYPDQVLLNDAVPVFLSTYEEDNFMLRPEVLESKITKKTKAIILNSPSNPTGLTYDRKTLQAIAEIALKHNIYIISDEIYEKLVYDDIEFVSIASLDKEVKNKTIVVNGLSKSHAMTGWRIGYAAGPKDIIKAMTNIQSQSTSNPTSIAQKAAVAALTGPQDFISIMHAEFDRRRKFLVDGLNSIEGVRCLKPTGAFYAFPNISKLYGKKAGERRVDSSLDMAMYLLEDARVALVHGEAFGNDAYIRISYATSMENIDKGLERIKEAMSRLK
ncbi:aminotransferase [Dissulfurispira thermophila]|uniref:Aminotransferase n=2 Tax=root TaxID=1 RepID=A0A7G1H467_9BACT|nr:pyridoxal phosphate-dependent aminotransferase [Dissulfurispira thermophila]BCB96716.1 aminotransferase [Dissulfurispira thermophila]